MPKFIELYGQSNCKVMVNTSQIRSYRIKDTLIETEIENKIYHKNFTNSTSRDQFIERNLQPNDSKPLEELKELKEQMKKINENIEEIRDMIKYQPGSQVYMESKEDFDKKNDS